mmetsp:Transcript_8188/g.20283  ORF Transcript_8188/g.20283 Transcript_8188/m.20283 type:complete len:213 (+) Transcript_8188:1111-1749(+)
MAMRVLVSRCMRFCVLPRGPITRPIKLYPGNSLSGTTSLRVFLDGRQSAGGRNMCGHRDTSHPMRSERCSTIFSRMRISRVFCRTPFVSYRGGGEGDRACSGLSSANSLDAMRCATSVYRAYCLTTSGSSLSAGVTPFSMAPGSSLFGMILPTIPARWALIAASSGTPAPPLTSASALPIAPASSAVSQRLLRLRERPSRSVGRGAGSAVSR